MSLTRYKQKRDFKRTAEPSDGRGNAPSGKLLYVIQKHAASRLHYDFRLELGGTLKSWAVPKGPSLDPHDKQLAVHVEDHPVSYGDFEGIIPQGEYGGGTVMVWDQGTWEPLGNASRDYRAGKLKFTLHGQKLKGNWALIEMHGAAGADGKNWLLIKEKDDQARSSKEYLVTEDQPLSVLSKRNLDEIAASADQVWSGGEHPPWKNSVTQIKQVAHKRVTQSRRKSEREELSHSARSEVELSDFPEAKRAPLPQKLAPQLATLVSAAPRGDEWLHELKFDGYRLLAFVDHGKIQLFTRNGNDWTAKFPTVKAAVGKFPLQSGILDGEVVALREKGIPDFQRLQNAMKSNDNIELIYYLFDLPFCDGDDLRNMPLLKRKQILEQRIAVAFPNNTGVIRFSDHIQGQGTEVASQSCRHEMEGIISKRIDSPYESGRSRSWVKTKCHKRQEFVIGGYTRPQGSRTGFGSLLIGYYEEKELRYCGRVGTGFTQASLRQVQRRLKQVETDSCPFASIPAGTKRQLGSWVKPELVAEVEFSEWTDDNFLRHPSFKGLREDKSPASIIEEKPIAVPISTRRKKAATKSSVENRSRRARHGESKGTPEICGIAISHPDRIVYSTINLTKLKLAQFYSDITDWILPHVVGRPLSLVRCPGGQDGECFYQKHFQGTLPQGITSVRIKEKNKTDEYPLIHDITGLISLIQWGMLEIHPWGSRVDNLERPDRIVFDLDPGEEATWSQVIQGVKDLHERLQDLGLESFLRTSGGKGLHVVVPLIRLREWDEVKDFAHAIASAMMHDAPTLYIDNMSKAKRKGRIFIDYLRNGRGATAISSYSTRARKGAPVATPLRWEELTARLRPNQYTVQNLCERLHALKQDPWENFFDVRQSLTKQMIHKY